MEEKEAGWGTLKLGTIELDIAVMAQIFGILLIAFVSSRVVKLLMTRFIHRSSTYLKVDKTRYNFLRNIINSLIYVFALIAIIHTIPSLRMVSTTLVAGAGIFAAVLGFASQQAFSNIIGGIFVVMSRPFRVGDVIKVGQGTSREEYAGTVEDITLRHTVIRDFQNRRIIIPNSVINNETIINNNILDERARRHINIRITYDADIGKAISIMSEEARNHRFFIDARTPEEKREGVPDVIVRVVELNEFGVNLRAYVWARNFAEGFEMHCDLNRSIKERFQREGFEFPYPHHIILQKERLPEA